MALVCEMDGCWMWMGSINKDGYGYFRLSRHMGFSNMAHRASLYLLRDVIVPPKMELDHLCCNKACVNPDHLEIVTHKENVQRMARRRRELKKSTPGRVEHLEVRK